MKHKNILAILLVFLIIIVFFSCKKEQSTTGSLIEEPLPIDISLRYVQGVDGLGSLAILRLYSRQLLQLDINDTMQKTDTDRPDMRLFWPKKNWNENVGFFISSGNNSEFQTLETEFRVISAPEQEELIFEAGKVFEAIVEFEMPAVLPPGSFLIAEMRLPDSSVQSNDVEIPASPSDKKEIILQKMRLLLLAGEYKELLAAAEEAISQNQNDHSGYWYSGLALESIGEDRAALAAFTEALEKYPKPSKGEFSEPPMRLVKKIRDLKLRIQD